MKKIYFAYSITNNLNPFDYLKLCIDFLKKRRYTVIHPENLSIFQQYLVKRAIFEIKHSDIIIADISNYSHGVGFELGYAYALEKDIIIISNIKSECHISQFIKGVFQNIYYYSEEEELFEYIRKKLKEINKKKKKIKKNHRALDNGSYLTLEE